MNNKQRGILKKAAALMTALLMLLAAVPASFAASGDWTELVITLSWINANGEEQSTTAVPEGENEAGEGCFWALVAPDAPLYALVFNAVHPMHEYVFSPASWRESWMQEKSWTDLPAFPSPRRRTKLPRYSTFIFPR